MELEGEVPLEGGARGIALLHRGFLWGVPQAEAEGLRLLCPYETGIGESAQLALGVCLVP